MSGTLSWAVYILPAIHGVAIRTSPFHSVMLSRRSSTDVAPDQVSPQPTSGSFGGRQSLSLATNQQAFRAHTAEAVETESPKSEISPQVTPPFPPRPTSHLPPSIGGLGRRSTRQGSYGTYASALGEYVPATSPPPSALPIPSPQTPGHSPPTPMRHRQQLAPGGGIGGFVFSPSQHGPSRGDSHHNTADYTYRFDTMPSSDSDPPHYESEDVTGGIHAKVWPTYNKISKDFDEKRLRKWNSDLDVLLIFVSLVVGGKTTDSDRTDAIYRLPCSPPSSQHSLSGPSTIYSQIINNSQPFSFINC